MVTYYSALPMDRIKCCMSSVSPSVLSSIFSKRESRWKLLI